VEPAVRSRDPPTLRSPPAVSRGGIPPTRCFGRLGGAARVNLRCRRRPGSGKTFPAAVVDSARLSWPGAPPGYRCRARSVIRSGSGSRWPDAPGGRPRPHPPLVRPLTARAGPGRPGQSSSGCSKDPGTAGGTGFWLVIDDVHELALHRGAAPAGAAGDARRRTGCGSCSPPGMTCGWGCTGCGWRASLTEIRAADLRFTLAEARGAVRRSRDPAAGHGAGVVAPAGPRAGRPGCAWPRLSLFPGTRTRRGSPKSFFRQRADGGRLPAGRGAGTAERGRSGGCCCAPRWPSGSAASWPTC